MTLADDLSAPPLARRVAAIIKDHAARLELGPDWADAAALRVLVEVGRSALETEASASNAEGGKALAVFEALFAGGPDTSCRTTWPDGVECVEVPVEDLRAAFAEAKS